MSRSGDIGIGLGHTISPGGATIAGLHRSIPRHLTLAFSPVARAQHPAVGRTPHVACPLRCQGHMWRGCNKRVLGARHMWHARTPRGIARPVPPCGHGPCYLPPPAPCGGGLCYRAARPVVRPRGLGGWWPLPWRGWWPPHALRTPHTMRRARPVPCHWGRPAHTPPAWRCPA
jgi:hypothetical protein